MTTLQEKVAMKVAQYRLALTTFLLSGLVEMASAATDLNASIFPIINDVTKLFVPILAVIIAAVPLIITLAVIGFILGILAAILMKLKIS